MSRLSFKGAARIAAALVVLPALSGRVARAQEGPWALTNARIQTVTRGVIEHGTMIDDATARFVADKGAYIVPTMVIIFALIELGKTLGFPPESMEKARIAFEQAVRGMESMRRAKIKIGFGTDLLGQTYTRQCREFTIRREVLSPVEILRQATLTNAAILQQEGKLCCVAPGGFADLRVVAGDPVPAAVDVDSTRAARAAGTVPDRRTRTLVDDQPANRGPPRDRPF